MRNYSSRYETLFLYLVSIMGFVFCYATLPLTASVLDIISPLNETRLKRMPHPAEFFVNQDKYYYVLLLNTYIGYVACVSIAVATDTMYVLLVEHICGMYDILWWDNWLISIVTYSQPNYYNYEIHAQRVNINLNYQSIEINGNLFFFLVIVWRI